MLPTNSPAEEPASGLRYWLGRLWHAREMTRAALEVEVGDPVLAITLHEITCTHIELEAELVKRDKLN